MLSGVGLRKWNWNSIAFIRKSMKNMFGSLKIWYKNVFNRLVMIVILNLRKGNRKIVHGPPDKWHEAQEELWLGTCTVVCTKMKRTSWENVKYFGWCVRSQTELFGLVRDSRQNQDAKNSTEKENYSMKARREKSSIWSCPKQFLLFVKLWKVRVWRAWSLYVHTATTFVINSWPVVERQRRGRQIYSLLPPSLSLAGLELTSLDLSANLISAVPFDLIQEVNATLTHLFMGGNVFVELGYMTTSK